uniref:Small ribosomal subunit protein uS8c n=1 Tax=Fusochloris perforata TaxID=106203 RepID=A0A097KPW0_9CHLO|nr:ribosomal protein S8 [Fusochloris perforata]AIT95216.1 ribosomal protein S8 [Fusochloris perforata]
MVNDTVSDMLTRIRNANLVKNPSVSIPKTILSLKICEILEKEGLIDSYKKESLDFIRLDLKYKGTEKIACITNLRRISKPGLRVYTNHKEIPKILGGMGVVILSTSQGIMTDREARLFGIGGEILCTIW